MGILRDANKIVKDGTRVGVKAKRARGIPGWIEGALHGFGRTKGDPLGAAGAIVEKPIKVSGSALKWGALAAVAAGGLAYIASQGKKTPSAEAVANEALEPEDFGAIVPESVPEEAVLEPLGETMAMQEQGAEQDTTWQDRVRGDGPKELATVATPDAGKDAEHVGLSLGA